MAKVYPVTSQIVQTVSSVTLNNDGSALVSLSLGYLESQEGSDPLFRSVSATSHVVTGPDAADVINVTEKEAGESYSDHLARCLLIQLQNSGRAVR
jgi:hypothetical protein